MAPRGAPTAYFLFSEEHRASAKAELEAQSAKAGVAQVAQLIGAKWKALSDEEKQAYKDRAQQLKEAAVAEAAAAAAAEQGSPGGEGEDGAEGEQQAAAAGGGGGAVPPPFGFPTGLVKRIIMVDDEVQRVSADAVRAIAKATELFVQQLAVKALEHAQAGKRKNFKAADVAHVASRDRRLVDMGLKDILEEQVAAAAGGAEEENANKRSNKRQKQEQAAAGTRQITAFFGAAAT